MGNLHVLEGERNTPGKQILVRQPRIVEGGGVSGGKRGGYLVNMLGVCLTNARVEMLKVSKPRFSSLSRFYCLNFLKKRGKIPFLSLLDFH